MRILMVHISDLHVNEYLFYKPEKITKLVSAINNYDNIDSVFLICSGDVANKSKISEYQTASKAIGHLLACLGEKFNKFIHFLCVPGNHDIFLSKIQYDTLDDINGKLSNEIEGSYLLKKEFEKQENYYGFMKNNNWIGAVPKDISTKKININNTGFLLNARLINTAPFSMLTHLDKEFHYVNPNSISALDNICDLNITIMHHSEEWFHESVKIPLHEKITKTTDILFLGHEHNQSAQILFENGSKTVISRGGIFDVCDLDTDAQCNILLYDTNDKEITFQTFSWNKKDRMYLPNGRNVRERLGIKFAYDISQDFYDSVLNDEKMNYTHSFLDYYVMPKIRNKQEGILLNVESIRDLKRLIDEAKYVNICAGNDLGKSALLKGLYCEYVKSKFVIFLKSNDFANTNIKKVLKEAISYQYNDVDMYNKFLQYDINQKIVIIDDFDKIKNDEIKYELIKYLKTVFSIIIISSDNNNVDLKQKFKDEYSLELNTYTLLPLTNSRRVRYIEKIMKTNNVSGNLTEISEYVENKLSSTFNLKMVGNTFLLNFISQNVINYNTFSENGRSNFDVIFETTLKNLIINNTNHKDTQTYLRLLEIIASYMHFNKIEFINISKLGTLIDNYRKEYEDKVGTNDFINSMIKCKIFSCRNDDNYTFTNRMYLAYFVAKNICFEINSFGQYDSFQYVLENVCFGINGDILLFIVYILQNVKIVSYIYDKADEISKSWEKLSFEYDNINCFTNIKSVSKSIKIDTTKKEEYEDKKEASEIENIDKYNISCHGLYDYDENELKLEINQILCLHKCIQLMSRSLLNFSSILSGDLKHAIAEALYDLTDKFLYRVLKPLDDDFDNFCRLLNEDGDDDSLNKIKLYLNRYLLHFVALVYNDVAKLAVSQKSISILLSECDNELATNRIMKFAYIHNSNDSDERILLEIKEFLKKFQKPYVLQVLKTLVIKHLLERDVDYRTQQKILAAMSSTNNKLVSVNEKTIFLKKIKQKA